MDIHKAFHTPFGLVVAHKTIAVVVVTIAYVAYFHGQVMENAQGVMVVRSLHQAVDLDCRWETEWVAHLYLLEEHFCGVVDVVAAV